MGGGAKRMSHEDVERALDLEHLRDQVPLCSFWNHRKTGHTYQVTGHCIIEATLQPAVLYTRQQVTWCRPAVEFIDGRFEEWTEE